LSGTDLVFAVVDVPSNCLAAFARVLTDRAYLALVLDVIVSPAYRRNGLGRLLMDRICAAPELEKVTSIELVCQPELVPFYEKWGFSDHVGQSRLMRRTSDRALTDNSSTGSCS
jgi:predicted GNAT family N-acyltransferase